MTTMMTKTADYYRALPYTRRVRFVEEDSGEAYFVAYIEELPGLETDGDDPTDALANLSDAFEDYLAAMFEWGDEIPEPTAWPVSLGWKAKRSKANARVAVVAIADYVADVPKSDDPASKMNWITGVTEDATAETALVHA